MSIGQEGRGADVEQVPDTPSSRRAPRYIRTQPVHAAPRPPQGTIDEEAESGTRSGPLARNRYLLTVLAGDQLGQVIQLDRDEFLIGRGDHMDVRIVDPGLSWTHARLRRQEDGYYLEDLASTNGTFVGRDRIRQPVRLVDGDRIQFGGHTTLKFSVVDELEESAALRLYQSMVHDALTGVFNRRYLEERLASEVSFAGRHGTTLALLLIDVDHFKRVNDLFGHNVGDATLRVIAASIQRILRPEDVLARYGGEEFIVLARSVSIRNAEILGERIRHHVEQLELALADDLPMSVSVGVAVIAPGRMPPDAASLLLAADEAMYEAKAQGRNRVVIH